MGGMLNIHCVYADHEVSYTCASVGLMSCTSLKQRDLSAVHVPVVTVSCSNRFGLMYMICHAALQTLFSVTILYCCSTLGIICTVGGQW